MKTRFYTVMVVPHHGRRIRSFVVSRRFLAAVLVLGFLIGIGGILFPRLYLTSRTQGETLAALRTRNASLRASLGKVDAQLVELRARMAYYEQEARKLALLAGLDELPSSEAAAGGAPGPEEVLGGEAPAGVRNMLEELHSLNLREERLTDNFAALASGYEELEKSLASIPSISPVPEGYLGSPYGWRKDPFTGRRAFHQGQDIVANTGTPIHAPARGKVTRAGRRGGLGLSVSVSHGNGLVTRYGHLSKIQVKAGQKLERGDVIGRVGSTGRSLGPHLHYEIFKNGRQIDPKDFLLQDPRPPVS